MNTSFFGELLASISEQGRALLTTRIGRKTDMPLVELCEALLSGRGEASGVAFAAQILEGYEALSAAEREEFFRALLEDFSADINGVLLAARELEETPDDHGIVRRLHTVSEPRRQELIRRLNRAPGGTRALVRMRSDLLDLLPLHPGLRDVDRDFEHLFSSWFNRGFLVMKHIDWSTPASILEKIIKYEAVHEIEDWEELRRRTGLEDRRLYAFFHPALVDDPLIFVEVALTREMPDAIAPILAKDRKLVEGSKANTAVFYSISNCQKGLRGISFGNFLIKQVVEDLQRELPALKRFVTLSPVPGFVRWVMQDLTSKDGAARPLLTPDLQDRLELDGWWEDEDLAKTLHPVLISLCAHYLTRERDRKGRLRDPVARFHIGNGARLERINWPGDLSGNGIAQSYGLMVNYLYDLRFIEKNHEAFAATGAVAASSAVTKQARSVPDNKQAVPAAT
ncbi:malonyl-CoA decarboxylase [Roseibium sp. RKSG952]|uniref:malonyl-CoA decarboxylase n=1 Tax=Roseibium sp. RKSG952 TaxID=2529384 RepID=UPI0012BC91E4|nr:malonyl-CoA decarboxylase [Roseibium sp. RKSG952]MTH97434.1 MCD, Malonyl-CoA decarboxylase MCD [Roseibium sp. RKSG952]